jgi:hypothetical protein
MGLCESTNERTRRPQLVGQLMHLSRPYSMLQAKQNGEDLSSYEGRLHPMLMQANYRQLEHMIGQNIMPILDARLKDQKEGLWSTEIYAGKRILSLYDRGDLESPFLERGNLDHIASVFTKTAYIDCNKKHKDAVYLGKIYPLGKVISFAWDTYENMSYETKRNPWLSTPPQDFCADPSAPKPVTQSAKPEIKR